MEQIKWCLNQKKGIELIEPNDNLKRAHILKAEEALQALKTINIKDWKITTAYYTIYHGIYSLLMKIGIKCEIHSCTIEFTKQFLKQYFTEKDFKLIDKAFTARIDSQYYVNRKVSDKNYNLIMEKTPEFLLKCKNIILEENEIKEIRKQLSKIR